MSDGGKGDTPRPLTVPLKQFDNNWNAIFKNRLAEKTIKQIEDHLREQANKEDA